MANTVTLISSLENACISSGLLENIASHLGSQQKELYPGVAYDFNVADDVANEQLLNDVGSEIVSLPIDIIIQPQENRRKKVFLADMDSTIIGQECIDELAAELGIKDKVAKITEAAMNGEIDFETALKDRVALLAGLEENIVSKVLDERITINQGTKEALAVMRDNGTHTALVSGGFTVFAKEIASAVSFHEYHANILQIEEGKFSGTVEEPILGQQAKLDQLNRLANEKNLHLDETIAIGDGANDLPMLLNAGTGIAYHAKPTVAEQAKAVINHGDLTSILFIQGYTKEDMDKAMA